MNKLQKNSGLFLILINTLIFSFVFLSCSSEVTQLPSHISSSAEQEAPETTEEEEICLTKIKDTEPFCWAFPYCRNFCDELFINKKEEEACYNWPLDLAEDFSSLYETMSEGVFQDLQPETLKCFLNLTENNKVLFQNLNEEESKEFLMELSFNHNLAYHLAKADKGDFSVFNTLFRNIQNRRISGIKESLGFRKENFLIEIHKEENLSAWSWLNDYIVHLCRRDSKCKEPLDYYCEILKPVKNSSLEDFLENSPFKKKYQRVIEAKICDSSNCEYGNIQNFKEMCDNI